MKVHRLKRYNIAGLAVVVVVVFIVFSIKGEMTLRQKLMKAVYPLIMWVSQKQSKVFVNEKSRPLVDFYSLSAFTIDGNPFSFSGLKGKKVLLVNTASDCGFTPQYEALEALYKKYSPQLVVLGFPANDFKAQESGTDETIADFCRKNYGVTFPMMKKTVVVKSPQQHPVYRWLTDAAQNGWNNREPKWNFTKYLVNEEGQLTHVFDPGISPMGREITMAVSR